MITLLLAAVLTSTIPPQASFVCTEKIERKVNDRVHDNLSARVSFESGRHEEYQDFRRNGHPVKQESLRGWVFHGEYAAILRKITLMMGDSPLVPKDGVFNFHLLANTQRLWLVSNSNNKNWPELNVEVTLLNGNIVKVTGSTIGYMGKDGAKQLSWEIDQDWIDFQGDKYLLPISAHLQVKYASHVEEVSARFEKYKRYGAESVVNID